MKRLFILFVLVNSIIAAHSQSFTDSVLLKYCKKAFYETALPWGTEMYGGSVIVSETQTGIVKALINFHQHEIDGWSESASIDCYVPALNSPLALFLALLDAGADPEERFYTTGVLLDEQAGVIIRDWGWKHGGLGNIRLSEACQGSKIALLEACEAWFNRSQATAAFHLAHTGIFLGDEDDSLTDYQSYCDRYGDVPWQPLALLGVYDKLKVCQIHMYTSGIANNGTLLMPRLNESDPYVVIYDSMANHKHIEIVRNCMFQNMEGLSRKVKEGIEGVQLFGFSNVSEPNGSERTSLFTGFFDKYTITITVNMHYSNPLIKTIPQKLASCIIKYLSNKRDSSNGEQSGTYKPHRAEK